MKFGGATATAERSIVRVSAFSSPNVADVLNDKGNHVVKGLRIFKVGTFKDSWGIERTWDSLHLDGMIAHYNLLKDNNIFPNVPQRADHSLSVKDVVGYFVDLYRDPTDANFLAYDIEFTEPDAYEKYKRGTWRSRSIEVGMYETNDGAAYFPTVMGAAFVDIPAVEGLHGKPQGPIVTFSQVITDEEETPVSMQPTPPAPGIVPTPPAPAAPAPAAAPPAAPPAAEPPAPAPAPAPQPVASSTHAASGQPFMFRVNGQDTADFAAVQRHITALETSIDEASKAARTEYVTNLAKTNKIAATQIDDFQAHVATMSPEQFEGFRKLYDGAGSAPLFANHGGQPGDSTNPQDPTAPQNGEPTEVETIEEIISNFRRMGKSEEWINNTKFAKRLVVLQGQSA
jgi:hypothetical protein